MRFVVCIHCEVRCFAFIVRSQPALPLSLTTYGQTCLEAHEERQLRLWSLALRTKQSVQRGRDESMPSWCTALFRCPPLCPCMPTLLPARRLTPARSRCCCVAPPPPGTQSSIQDWPGRTGMWRVGVPPSGACLISSAGVAPDIGWLRACGFTSPNIGAHPRTHHPHSERAARPQSTPWHGEQSRVPAADVCVALKGLVGLYCLHSRGLLAGPLREGPHTHGRLLLCAHDHPLCMHYAPISLHQQPVHTGRGRGDKATQKHMCTCTHPVRMYPPCAHVPTLCTCTHPVHMYPPCAHVPTLCAGPMDSLAHRTANALVGNDECAAGG